MSTSSPYLASGLWGVLATPFHADSLEIDESSLRREVELFGTLAAAGLVVLGVFGESASLTPEEQERVVRVVSQSKGKECPIVIGISTRDTNKAIDSARALIDASDGSPVSLMLQVNASDPNIVAEHLHRVHEATEAAIVVQDYPLISGVSIDSDQLILAIAKCSFVAAIKSEAPPTSVAIAELSRETSVPIFGGLGGIGLLDELMAGSSGAMTGFSHPEGLAKVLDAWNDGGIEAATLAFQPWMPLVNFEAQARVGLGIRKASFCESGIFSSAAVRPPGRNMPDVLMPILRQHLELVRIASES